MPYSRQELIAWDSMSQERFKEITTDLLQKLVDKRKLTLAESKFICLKTRNIFKAEDDSLAFKATDYSQCDDFLFWDKYLLYWNDHEGWGKIKNGPDTYVTDDEKKHDVSFLNDHYLHWKTFIDAGKFSDGILQTVANETKRLIREITEASKNMGEGSNRRRYIEKALILHSKYLYFQVTEYYEENPAEEQLTLCGHLIVVDHFVYIHTLFGHFAATVKFNRPGKSYHRTDNVDFRNIPKFIRDILADYNGVTNCAEFNSQRVYFNFRGTDYAIWFRPMTRSVKGKGEESFLRVQTFYPVELPEELSKVATMSAIKVNDIVSIYN